MKTKLRVLVSSIAAMLFVLAFVLSQFTTNSSGKIHELTAAEMAAITGTGTCKSSVTTNASGSGTCNNGISCSSVSACGTGWTHYYTNTTCTGSTITQGPACGLVNTGDPRRTEYTCECGRSLFNWSKHCKTKSTDHGSAKQYQADTSHDCGGTTI